MTCASLDRTPASLRHEVLRVPNDPGIVNDCRARVFREECLCKKTDDIFSFDEFACVIKEEAAVKITVPGNAKISASCANGLCGRGSVFWKERVWDALREAAVRLVE